MSLMTMNLCVTLKILQINQESINIVSLNILKTKNALMQEMYRQVEFHIYVKVVVIGVG